MWILVCWLVGYALGYLLFRLHGVFHVKLIR